MRISTGYEDKRVRIEMIALIDVVFLLLVFFIYAMLSMTVQRGVEVVLPQAGGVLQEESIIITIDKDSRLFFEERELQPAEVVELVRRRFLAGSLPVLIRGDREADLGLAIELLSRLREKGIEQVSFQVEEPL